MLSKKLQSQITAEGRERAKGCENRLLAFVAKTEYELGAEKYGELWEAAEKRAERAEKALKEISQLPRSAGGAYKMQAIAIYALTPKTSDDE